MRLLLFLLAVLSHSSAYRILVVFPTAAYSHQRAQIAVSKALAAHGHEVTILSTDPFETTNPQIRQINLSFLYDDVKRFIKGMTNTAFDPNTMMKKWTNLVITMMDEIFSNSEVRAILENENEKFDAVIVEYQGYAVAHALAEKFNATLIAVTTMSMWPWGHRAMGNPAHPLIHPLVVFNHPENPNLFEKIKILYDTYMYDRVILEMFDAQEPTLKKHFPENTLSPVALMTERVDFAIECVSPAQGFVRPLLPNTKQIGFIHIEEPKDLPKDLKAYLDASNRGVVYFSLGSNVKSINLHSHIFQTFKQALAAIPYDVLWKYENQTMPGKPDNVVTVKWTPQEDLLAHPNIRLFVTQGGFQSSEEAMARGVPVVVIPFFGDQEHNAGSMEKLGLGKRILKEELTVETLKSTMIEVIENPRYKENIVALGKIVRDTPMNATETAVWYIEHAVRNRGSDLFKYKKVSFFEFYFLDIGVFLCLVLFVTSFVLLKLSRKLVKCFKKNQKIKISTNKKES